jgi:hypothetical protein
MSVRTTEAALGRDFRLLIKKGTDITVGCANNITYTGQKEVLTGNCQNGKIQMPSGDDPTYSLQVSGSVFIYSSANASANISSTEIEQYMQDGEEIEWVLTGKHEGDPTRSGTGFVTNFELGTPVEGFATYNFTITPFQMPVIGTVAG